jgi:hypothetical protein
VRDSDVLELAEAFLLDGANEQSQADAGQGPVDVSLDIYFGDGYTLNQVSATLDALDLALTAGFIAAEARETGQNPAELLERLVSADDPLDLVWRIEYTEAGSPLRIRAVVERVGNWVSKYQAQTIWLLGGVSVVMPLFGVPVVVAAAAAAGAWVAVGAVQGIAAHNRNLSRKQAQGPKAGLAQTAAIEVGLAPAG